MRILSSIEQHRPPAFLQFHYGGEAWDIIVHASIPIRFSGEFDLLHQPITYDTPFMFLLVIAGQGRIIRGKKQWPLKPGHLLLVDATQSNILRSRTKDHLHLVPFSFSLRRPDGSFDLHAPLPDILETWSGEPLLDTDVPVALDDLRAKKFHELLLALNSHLLPGQKVEWFSLHLRALELLAMAITAFSEDNPSSTADPGLQRVRNRIERDFASPLSLDELAHEAGLSPHYLCRKFKAAYGLPPQQYQQHIQIRAACNHLRNTTLRIKEIAQQTGFTSPEHFTRLFRKRLGMSPRKYRAAAGPPD